MFVVFHELYVVFVCHFFSFLFYQYGFVCSLLLFFLIVAFISLFCYYYYCLLRVLLLLLLLLDSIWMQTSHYKSHRFAHQIHSFDYAFYSLSLSLYIDSIIYIYYIYVYIYISASHAIHLDNFCVISPCVVKFIAIMVLKFFPIFQQHHFGPCCATCPIIRQVHSIHGIYIPTDREFVRLAMVWWQKMQYIDRL